MCTLQPSILGFHDLKDDFNSYILKNHPPYFFYSVLWLQWLDIEVTIPRSRLQWLDTEVTIPRNRLQWLDTEVTIPRSRLQWLDTEVTVPRSRLQWLDTEVTIPRSRFLNLLAKMQIMIVDDNDE
jgi:hypothetical protein